MRKRVLLSVIALLLVWWLWPTQRATTPTQKTITTDRDQTQTTKQVIRSAPVDRSSQAAHLDTADEDEEPANWTVQCPLPMDAPYEGEVVFAEVQPTEEGVLIERVKAEIRNGVLLVEAKDPLNSGSVRVPGYPDLDWRPPDGGCPDVSLQVVSAVMGTVSPSFGNVRVSACGTTREADADGGFYVPATPGACRVQAYRTESGGVLVYGEEKTIDVTEGQDALVDLSVPEEEWGSIGLTLTQEDERTVVKRVIDGGPADAAGIGVGDELLVVDGRPAQECDRGWLYSCFHGPVGSTVTLEFADGDVLELSRNPLPDKRPAP